MRKVLAFAKRDLQIEASYRFYFASQVVSIALSIASYYFLARFVGPPLSPLLRDYGGDYFAFILIGVALNDYLTTSLNAFSRSIRESQLAGTLEALLTTRTSLSTIIVSSAVYPFLWTSLNVLFYIGLGFGLFGLRFARGNWPGALVVLAIGILVFSGFGILSASFIMVFKRASPVAWLMGSLSWLLGGVLYPVSVLPGWLQSLAALLPITHAIEGMRAALLQGQPWSGLVRPIGALALFAAIVLPLSLLSFERAVRQARIDGSLGQY